MANTFYIKSNRNLLDILDNAIQYLETKTQLNDVEQNDLQKFKTLDLENPDITYQLVKFYRCVGEFASDLVYDSICQYDDANVPTLYDCVDESFSDWLPLKGIDCFEAFCDISEYYKFVDNFNIWEDWEFPNDCEKFENYTKQFFTQNPNGILCVC